MSFQEFNADSGTVDGQRNEELVWQAVRIEKRGTVGGPDPVNSRCLFEAALFDLQRLPRRWLNSPRGRLIRPGLSRVLLRSFRDSHDASFFWIRQFCYE